MPLFLRSAVLGVLAALLVAPGQAMAGSIALIEDNNVWLYSPDGSRRLQVTTDGTESRPYSFPSQADDGTILAEIDRQFVRLRPDGSRIGAPVPGLGSDARHSGNVTIMAGPAAPKISPDGTRFAYWISARGIVSCPIFDPGCSYQDTDYTIVSHVDRFTDPAELGAVDSYRDPSWIGNDRLLVFSHGVVIKQAAISTVGAGQPGLQQWFDPPYQLPQIDQGEITRQGDKLVTLAGSTSSGFSEEYVMLYALPGAYPAAPEPKCYLSDAPPPSREFTQPTWSPDGTQLAVVESDGVHVYSNIPDLRAPSPDCSQITERFLAYASEPGWGPADVPGGTPPPAGGGSTPTAPTRPAGGAGVRPAAVGSLRVAPHQTGRAVRVRVRVRIAGSSIRVALLAGKPARVLGATDTRSPRPSTLSLRVPLNRRGRAALRRTHRLRLAVRTTVQPPGAPAVTITRRVTLH